MRKRVRGVESEAKGEGEGEVPEASAEDVVPPVSSIACEPLRLRPCFRFKGVWEERVPVDRVEG